MRRRAFFAAVVFFCLVPEVATTAAQSTPPVTIRVGYLPATHDSLLFVAKELGLFERVDVQMKPYDNSVQILNDLKSGILDIGIPGMATPANDIGGKAPLSIIGGAAAKSAALVVRPADVAGYASASTPNAKLKLLRRRHVGAVRGSTGLAILREGLVRAGVDDKDIDLRNFTKPSEIINALVGGELDAGLLWSPHMTLAKERGLEVVLWMSDILPNHVCCRQVAKDEFLLAHRAAAVEYLAGLLRADLKMRLARRDPVVKAAVFQAVRRYLTTLNDRQIEAELFASNPYTTVSPDLDEDGIHRYLDSMQTAGLMRNDQCSNVKQKVHGEYLQLAYQKLGCSAAIARNCVAKGSATCECTKSR